MSTRSMTRPLGALGYMAEVDFYGAGEEAGPTQKALVEFPLDDITRSAVAGAFKQAWPTMRAQIITDMPLIVESARPELQKEATKAGIVAGGIAAAAVALTAMVVWQMRSR